MKFELKVIDRYKYIWNLICEANDPIDIVDSLSPYTNAKQYFIA